MNIVYESDYLMHHGIKGQKWGVRRFQNADGSLTKAGANRYYTKMEGKSEKYQNKASEYGRMAKQANTYQDFKAARKYRRKEAKYLSKRLNNDDQLIAQAKYDSTMARNNQRHLEKSIAKAALKGNTNKLVKLEEKKADADRRANESAAVIQRNVSAGNAIVNSALQKKYVITTRETKRYVQGQTTVADAAALAVASLALSAATGGIGMVNSRTYVKGKKYKVRSI